MMNADQEREWSKSFCLGLRPGYGKQVNIILLKLELDMLHYLLFLLTTVMLKVRDMYENMAHFSNGKHKK